MIKKIFILTVLASLFLGCSLDDSPKYDPFFASVTSVEIPEVLIHGQTYTFNIHYERTNSCDVFSGFEYDNNGNEQIFAVINRYFPEVGNCEDGVFPAETDVEFVVERNDFYIFKFWQGENENGETQFLTIEVPVEQ